MGQSPDQIRQEIDQKRTDAADKIDQLQDQVQSIPDQVRQQAQDTVEQVRDQVKGTVDDTVQSVKENLDLRQQVEQRPLVALGAAFVGGFVLGSMGGGEGGSAPQGQQGYAGRSENSPSALSNGLRSAVQRSGLDETIANAAAALIGSVTDQLKGTLDRNFPGFATKMTKAQRTEGDLADKTRVTQSTTTMPHS